MGIESVQSIAIKGPGKDRKQGISTDRAAVRVRGLVEYEYSDSLTRLGLDDLGRMLGRTWLARLSTSTMHKDFEGNVGECGTG
jgi:hypothetical protein